MRLRSVVLALLAASSLVAAPSQVGKDAVWNPPSGFMDAVHKACDRGRPADFAGCFVKEMRGAGAPPPAIAFARATENQGYARAFRDTGKVDVAWAAYPFRANENQLCFLVNGAPAMIDVDDLSRIDKDALAANPQYAALAKEHPNVAMFPGNRSPGAGPAVRKLKSGGQRFLVSYRLLDGCRACAVLGMLSVGFDFDASGKLLGTKVAAARAETP